MGFNVWSPGERFVDLDSDSKWDGLDEKNDMMCHGPDGCPGDPPGSGPRGCTEPGCGDLLMHACDWNGDREFQPGFIPGEDECVIAADINGDLVECLAPPGKATGEVYNCIPEGTELPPCCECEDEPVPCVGPNNPPGCCIDGIPRLTCDASNEPTEPNPVCGQEPNPTCCEFDDSVDQDSSVDWVEPFEDYMIAWASG